MKMIDVRNPYQSTDTRRRPETARDESRRPFISRTIVCVDAIVGRMDRVQHRVCMINVCVAGEIGK